MALLRATGHGTPEGPWVPLGVGVHTGSAFVGIVGQGESSDFTALGDRVNIAAHLASQAAIGEILLTDPVGERAGPLDGRLERRHVLLKGHPIDALVLPGFGRRGDGELGRTNEGRLSAPLVRSIPRRGSLVRESGRARLRRRCRCCRTSRNTPPRRRVGSPGSSALRACRDPSRIPPRPAVPRDPLGARPLPWLRRGGPVGTHRWPGSRGVPDVVPHAAP